MTTVKWLGRFREFSGSPDDPSMSDAKDTASPIEALVVSRYLRSGHGFIDVMEIRRDVLDDSDVVESGSVLGDGRWIWREDLAHYVEKYRVGLDAEFLGSIVGQAPPLDEQSMSRATEDAFELWQHG